MTTIRVFVLVAFLFVAAGCHHSVSSHGYTRTSTNGVVYSCQIARIDSSDAPIFLLARSGGQGRDYSMKWETHGDGRMFVDGKSLAAVSKPTAYYKEDGRLKSKVVSDSGVWLALLHENGPTAEDLARVFNEIERGGP